MVNTENIIKPKRKIKPTQIIVLGMIIIILVGSILFKLPISNNRGKSISMLDSLFMSTSAVCITGFTTVDIIEQFSFFGQLVLLILIQIGGIGFSAFVTLVLLILGKKVNLSERLILQESLNLREFSGIIKIIIAVFKFNFIIEFIGAIIFSIRFVPLYGVGKGIYFSIFHSVSSVCNSGFELFESGVGQVLGQDILLNVTTIVLIIIGGLGFAVWYDIYKNTSNGLKNKLSIRRIVKKFSLHTKLVLTVTVILLVTYGVLFFILEYNNQNIFYNSTLKEKIITSAFMSANIRTAGFHIIDFTQITTANKFLILVYMLIGGSPGSTSGGIKTVTFAVMVLLIISFIKGRREIKIFNRSIGSNITRRATVIAFMSLVIIGISIFTLLITEAHLAKDIKTGIIKTDTHFIEILFEVVSAYSTTGIDLGITTQLSALGRIFVMFIMLIGRVGPITMSIAIMNKDKEMIKNSISYPEEDVIIG